MRDYRLVKNDLYLYRKREWAAKIKRIKNDYETNNFFK